ncbi:MAG TPA: DUF6249 domain-containing protein [Pyrinomonadaceae bacterium]|nr:DUF6249 domain-containing protein [Pyrinomonadaceae bacterium]
MIDPVSSYVIIVLILALVVLPIIYMAFRQWLRHRQRLMIHRERLAAIQKGVDLPDLEQEIERSSLNVQRTLLLAGLSWISLGITAFAVLSALLAHPSKFTETIPPGLQWIALAPVGIGISHLIVYSLGKKKATTHQ